VITGRAARDGPDVLRTMAGIRNQNGVEIDDPGELLYQVMLDAAAKTIGKTQIAATLRSLAAPSTERS